MSAKPYLKVSLLIKKLPTITDEQFRKHWKGPHADIALENETFVKYVRKYNQVHILPELKDMAKEYGQPITDADGIAEVWVDDIAAWKIIVSDPKFVEKIVPDEKLFLQHPITMHFSRDNLVIPEKE